jgi:hypothetical protein
VHINGSFVVLENKQNICMSYSSRREAANIYKGLHLVASGRKERKRNDYRMIHPGTNKTWLVNKWTTHTEDEQYFLAS